MSEVCGGPKINEKRNQKLVEFQNNGVTSPLNYTIGKINITWTRVFVIENRTKILPLDTSFDFWITAFINHSEHDTNVSVRPVPRRQAHALGVAPHVAPLRDWSHCPLIDLKCWNRIEKATTYFRESRHLHQGKTALQLSQILFMWCTAKPATVSRTILYPWVDRRTQVLISLTGKLILITEKAATYPPRTMMVPTKPTTLYRTIL